MIRNLIILLSSAMLVSCGETLQISPLVYGAARPDITVIVCDDCSPEQLSYNGHPAAAATPNIDQLATDGLTFDRFYSAPTCKPARSNIMLGAQNTRIHLASVELDPTYTQHSSRTYNMEDSLPATLKRVGYRAVALGKWHLGSVDPAVGNTYPGDPAHPYAMGFDHYEGSWANIKSSEGHTYEHWRKTLADGSTEIQSTYAVTDTANDVIEEYINTDPDTPLFTWFAPNAIHKPLHLPPTHLLNSSGPYEYGDYSKYMMEALDTEVGRAIAAHKEHRPNRPHIIVFVGDNGMYRDAAMRYYPAADINDPNYNHLNSFKGSGLDGGNVPPMIVTGWGVTERGLRTDVMVNGTDLHSTILRMANMSPDDIETDSIPFNECFVGGSCVGREIQFAERAYAGAWNHNYASRSERYIYAMTRNMGEVFFDMENDPKHTTNLLHGTLTPDESDELETLRAHTNMRLLGQW